MKKKTLKIIAQGATQRDLNETAPIGEAASATNVRECDGALRITGNPTSTFTIPQGQHLLMMDDERIVTQHDNQVMYNGTAIATLQGQIVGTHRVGQLLVVVTTHGVIWLHRTDNGYRQVKLDDACPDITLNAIEWDTVNTGLNAISFATPYSEWPTELNITDVTKLTHELQRGWNILQQDIDNAGTYSGLMLARFGVRLNDDTYLWLSEPTLLGEDTLQDAMPIAVETTLDGTHVTGTPSTTLQRHIYRIGFTINHGIADEWLPLVKSIDLLATHCIAPVNPDGSVRYRAIGIGGNVRRPQLEFSLPPISEDVILTQLRQSGWHIVASTDDLTSLNQQQWASDGVASSTQSINPGTSTYAVTHTAESSDCLTAAQATEVELSATSLSPIASTTSNGRLYCIDAQGMLTVSAVGNPLITARQQALTGATVRSIIPLSHALYSNGFGRYPLVLFTDEGIYALPQTATGKNFGEPRLLNRMVIAAESIPIEGNGNIYFNSNRGHLCRLRGSDVRIVWHNVGDCQLAWDDAHNELWALTADGSILVLMPSGRSCQRTLDATELYDDTTHALALDGSGVIYDLTQETEVEMQTVEWQSHPFESNTPKQVVWQVMGAGELSLQVTGERGISCHGYTVSRLRIRGKLNAPLHQLLVAPPCRTLRLHINGRVNSGTLILPTQLETK